MFDTFSQPESIAAAATAATGALYFLRNAFGKAALNRAERTTAQDIEFLKSETFFVRPDLARQENAALVGTLVQRGHAMSRAFGEQARNIAAVKADTGKGGQDMMLAGLAVGAIMANIGVNKFTSLLESAVQYKLAVAAGEHPAPLLLDPVSQQVLHLSDAIGLTDAAAAAQHAIAAVVPQQVLETAGHIAGEVLLPGVIAAGISAHREIAMLINGDVTWEELIADGLTPAAGRFALAFAGMKTDLAMAGHGFGVPTIAGVVGGIFFYDGMVKRKIKKEQEELRPYVAQIDTRRSEGAERLNREIDTQIDCIRDVIADHPVLDDDEDLRGLLRQAGKVFSKDTQAAIALINRSCQTMQAKIAPRTWVDTALGIDRPARLNQLFADARNNKAEAYRAGAAAFAAAMEQAPHKAAAALREQTYLRGGLFMKYLDRLRDELHPIAVAHDKEIGQWGQRCNKQWQTAQVKVLGVSKAENEGVASVVARLAPYIRPIQRRIAANCQRLGLSPPPDTLLLS